MIEIYGHQIHHSALLCPRSVIFEAQYEMQFNHDRKIRLVDGRCAAMIVLVHPTTLCGRTEIQFRMRMSLFGSFFSRPRIFQYTSKMALEVCCFVMSLFSVYESLRVDREFVLYLIVKRISPLFITRKQVSQTNLIGSHEFSCLSSSPQFVFGRKCSSGHPMIKEFMFTRSLILYQRYKINGSQ